MDTSLSRRNLLKVGAKAGIVTSLLGTTNLLNSTHAETVLSDEKMTTATSLSTNAGAQTASIHPQFNFDDIKTACEQKRDTGVKVHLIAPSGFGGDEQRNLLAIYRLTQAGFYIDNPEIIRRKHLRFAGTDTERVADFSQYLLTPVAQLPKILLGVRGGYGALRLFNNLAPEKWALLGKKFKQRGTLLIGFSDVTAIQLGLLAQAQMPYVAGAMLGSDFGKDTVNVPTIQSFIQLCTQSALQIRVTASQPFMTAEKTLTGMLWGGNLSVLSSMVGSAYFPKIHGGILYLEDTGEQPYRIERMLQTLELAGVLSTQKAILLGKFNFKGISDAYDGDYTFNTVLSYLQQVTKLPILTEFPFGHVAERINFPMGVPVTIHANSQGYTASFNHFYNLTQEKNYKHLDFSQLLV